jgi:probable F420-dependent oxidoreductase
VRAQLSAPLANYAREDPGSWEPLLARARNLDAAGVDRLVVFDHVVFGENLEAYGRPELGGDEGGRQPTGPDGHWLEPMTVLSVVAGLTSTIRLATGILIAALRRPAVLAKSAATLDVLSNGRLDLGVGVGWQREEYEAAGLAFEGRGKTLDVTLSVLQALWRTESASVDLDGLAFERIHSMPKPRQDGGVPIWVSGRLNSMVIERVVRFGSGWIPWGNDARDPLAGLPRLREALSAAGREPSDLQVAGTLPIVRGPSGIDVAASVAAVPDLVAAGITDFRANLAVPEDPAEALDLLSPLVSAFRDAAGR